MKAISQTKAMLASVLASVLLAFPLMAPAALETIEEVIELELDSVLLPGHEADQMRIRRCDECEELLVQVTRDTVYRLGGPQGEVVTLPAFVKAARNSNAPADLILLVAYAPESNRVTRMIISGNIG